MSVVGVVEAAADATVEAGETPTGPAPASHRIRLRRRVKRPVPRPEKCHNCGYGAGEHNYCANCGQENRTPRNGLFEIASDAWEEFVKIDSRLVQTAVALVCHPGRLTNDYISGKRVRYITPFRLYLTISFLFFVLLSNRSMSSLMSSLGPGYMHQSIPDALNSAKAKLTPGHTHLNVDGFDRLPKTVEAYHTAQAALPKASRDDVLHRFGMERLIGIQTRTLGETLSDLLTTVSRMMFFLLPAYALLLKLLYIRRKRTYVEHFVYALHIHAFFFLAFALYLLLPFHGEVTLLELGIAVYNVIALRCVYRQGIAKTLVKAFLLYSIYNIFFVLATLLAIAVAIAF